MNQHQEHHHGLHHQNSSDSFTQQIDISEPATGKADDRESRLDELEKMMFERAR
jgi:hypothetical protein